MFHCPDNDETTSAECSPRWIVYRNSYSTYVSPVNGVTTQKQCLDACVANSSCVAAAWWSVPFKRSDAYWRCQLLDNSHFFQHRHRRYGVSTYELVRRCRNPAGIGLTTDRLTMCAMSCYRPVVKLLKNRWWNHTLPVSYTHLTLPTKRIV